MSRCDELAYLCLSGYFKAMTQDEKIINNMNKIGRKILVMSGKGGVGKTTVTVNLANALVKQGYSVGILDTDIHGPNIAKMLGCEGDSLSATEDGDILPVVSANGIKAISLSFALKDPGEAIIFRGPMKIGVIKQFLADVQWGTLDYLLIDSPPGTGDEQLTICQTIQDLTGTVLVSTPQQVAILDARRSISFARQLDIRIIGLIENMSYLRCPDCNKEISIFGKDGGKNLCMEEKVPFLGGIPMEVELGQSEDSGLNWIAKNPESESAKVFFQIAEFIHKSTQPTEGVIYVPKDEGCSPSSCATCTEDCPSRKK